MLKNSSSSSVYLMQCCTVALNSAQCDSQCPAVKCGLANAAAAGQTGRGAGMLQRPPEKCQKSNREIWNSSQEIHPETCNEENNGVRNGEKSVEIFYCCRRVNIALEFCKNSRFATNLSLGSISCSSIHSGCANVF